MDQRLLAWARMVKRRRAGRVRRQSRRLPVLFLLTDDRLADPASVVRGWPTGVSHRGLFGIVLRARDPAGRERLANSLRPLCRTRGIALLVAGDPRLANRLGAGTHLARGTAGAARGTRPRALRSAAVHGMAELVAARRHGARFCFLSPVFATASHPGARTLGTVRLARLSQAALRLGLLPFALGGIDGPRVRTLPAMIAGAGAIGALAG